MRVCDDNRYCYAYQEQAAAKGEQAFFLREGDDGEIAECRESGDGERGVGLNFFSESEGQAHA